MTDAREPPCRNCGEPINAHALANFADGPMVGANFRVCRKATYQPHSAPDAPRQGVKIVSVARAITIDEQKTYARRYQWLRAHSWLQQGPTLALYFGPGCNQLNPAALDAAIEAYLHEHELNELAHEHGPAFAEVPDDER